MIYVVAKLTIKPGSLEAVSAAARTCIETTLKEAGCISYDLHASVSEPETLVFVERWETREHLTAHSKQPHLKVWREASEPFTVSRTIEIIHPERVETF